MTFSPGARLGPYEIIGAIGAGGMGEVFRARDTKLNRDVAIKVLPAAFADDPERLARFTREAQTLASLNHPNIAAIYGIEEIASSDSSAALLAMTKGAGDHTAVATIALVMELVEGEDLSAHIARGPIPINEALPIARQITEALEAAHEQGIVHRDLKPANIKVRTDGTVKVLDFGLAKAMDHGGGAANSALSHSPTMSRHMTEAGMIMGTAPYMSPEQARGKAVDKRTDVWAFGCVLYEMLSGRRAFDGEDATEIISAIVKSEPEWNALPGDLPAHLRAIVTRCLVKDRKTRIPDLSVVRFMLDGPLTPGVTESPTAAAPAIVPSWRRALPWAIASVFAVAFAVALWAPWRRPVAPIPHTLLASIGADASLTGTGATAILSPDGTTLAFAAQQEGRTRLFVRKLDQLQASALAGTEGASMPFFSPDGQWIAFFAARKLKKVSVTGGAAVNLCDAIAGRGGTWTDDDTIIFTPTNGSGTPLMRVPAAGGTPSVVGTLSEGATRQRWPQALPGGRVLYTENSAASGGWEGANLVIAPVAGGAPRVVVRGSSFGRYFPSGHMIYLQQGTLFAAPFDLDRLEMTGQGVPALEGVATNLSIGEASLAFSSEGTLVYVPGGATTLTNPVDWMTRDGKTSPLRAAKADWTHPRFSPDGHKLALAIADGKPRDIWVYEWGLDTLTQLTFDPGNDTAPVWTPDGRRIVFGSDRAQPGTFNLYWVNADGTGEATRLTDSPETQSGSSWDPGGRFFAFHTNRDGKSWDLMILPMEGDVSRGLSPGKPNVFLGTPAVELWPAFSPDGRWIAYQSNEAGSDFDVYVRPFPGPGGKWRISTGGGAFARWSATSHELLFVSQGKVMAAPYAVVGDSFRAEKPEVWSPRGFVSQGTAGPYDLHPDGKRLAIIADKPESAGALQDKVVFFFNFGDYLKKIAPVTKP